MTEPQHLHLDVLADLLVGEGSEADVDHVAHCPGCAARLAELDAAQAPVAAALAALPAPSLPRDLAERLAAALSDAGPLPAVEPERPGAGTTPGPAPDDPTARGAARTVTPLHRPARTWLPSAAVAVLVLSLGGLAVAGLSGGVGGGDDSDTAASSSGAGSESGSNASPESATRGLPRSESGTDYAATPDAFDRLLPDVLAGGVTPAAAADAAPGPVSSDPAGTMGMTLSAAPLERLRDPAALDACLSALLPPDGSAEPLAVDFAAYAGQSALVVVLSSSDPSKLDVFVVGPECAAGNDATLFFTRVDRPA